MDVHGVVSQGLEDEVAEGETGCRTSFVDVRWMNVTVSYLSLLGSRRCPSIFSFQSLFRSHDAEWKGVELDRRL